MSEFELYYDEGHRFNWYYILSKSHMAMFRLHHDNQVCWDMLKITPNKKRIEKSPVYSFGEMITDGIAYSFDYKDKVSKKINQIPKEFEFLENMLKKSYPNLHLTKAIDYIGMEFYTLK